MKIWQLLEAAVAKVLEDSLKYMDKTRISLAEAKKLIEKVEAFAVTKNKKRGYQRVRTGWQYDCGSCDG